MEELSFATQFHLRKSDKRSAASVFFIQEQKNTNELTIFLKIVKIHPISNSVEVALSLIINTKLSKQQYLLRSEANTHSVYIYQKKCYPESTSISITENSGHMKLQNILDLTTQRISCL